MTDAEVRARKIISRAASMALKHFSKSNALIEQDYNDAHCKLSMLS